MAELGSKRKLVDLRVVDLKLELEKRNLEKTGVKAALTERLKVALESEGLDPSSHEFYCTAVVESPLLPVKKMAKKKIENLHDGEEKDEPHLTFTSLAEIMAPEIDLDLSETNGVDENGETVPQSDLCEVDNVDEDDLEMDPLSENDNNNMADQSNANEVKLEDDDEPMSVQDEEPHIKIAGDGSKSAVVDSAPCVEHTAGGVDVEAEQTVDQDAPPNPETVEPSCPFTAQDTIDLHAAAVKKLKVTSSSSLASHALQPISANQSEEGGSNKEKEALNDETSSMYVNVDESVASVEDQGDATSVTSNGTGDVTSSPMNSTLVVEQPPLHQMKPTVESRSAPDQRSKGNDSKDRKEGSAVAKSQGVTKKTDSKAAESSVWVIGMASTIKAADLKSLFSKYGRVVTARVMSSKSKDDGNPQWYGHVTMGAADEAAKCITNLHRTELHGKLISVERASDAQGNHLPPRKVGVARPPLTTAAGSTTLPAACAVATGGVKVDSPSQKAVAAGTPTAPSKKQSTPVTATKATAAAKSTPSMIGGDKEKSSMVSKKPAVGAKAPSTTTKTTTVGTEPKTTTAEPSDKKKAGSDKSEKASSKDGKKEAERSQSKSKSEKDVKDRKNGKGSVKQLSAADRAAAARAASALSRRGTTFRPTTTSRGGAFRRPPPPPPPRGGYRGVGGYRGRGTGSRFAPSSYRRGGGAGPSYRDPYAQSPPSSFVTSRYGEATYRQPHLMASPTYGGSGSDFNRRRREDEVMERIRQKEVECRQREDILKIQREKERLKFEREKLEKEKLELQHHQQQMRMQAAYERSALVASSQMIGVKRAYEGLSPYSTPTEAKRVNYGAPPSAPQLSGGGAQRSSRRTPPRSSYGGRNDSSYSHQRGSSSHVSRYSNPASQRTSSSGGGNRRSYDGESSSTTPFRSSSSRRARGRRPSPPASAAPSRQSWRGGADVDSRSSGYAGGEDVNDWRRLASSSAVALSSTLTAPQWRALQSASSSQMFGAPGTENLSIYESIGGGVLSQSNPYTPGANTSDRFDAYKYSSSSRRY